MRRASSASATWRASRSASEYTATVRMPKSRAAAMTRQAISPRLATRILRNTLLFLPRRLDAHRFELLHPIGLAFLEEGGDALPAFRRDADFRDALRRVGDHGVVGGTRGHGADQVLDLGVSLAPAEHEVAEQRIDRAVEFFRRGNIRQQAHAIGLAGVDYFPCEKVAPREALAHGANHVGADGGGGEAESHLGEAELRVLRADRDVAGRDQADAAGIGGAVHARDGGL